RDSAHSLHGAEALSQVVDLDSNHGRTNRLARAQSDAVSGRIPPPASRLYRQGGSSARRSILAGRFVVGSRSRRAEVRRGSVTTRVAGRRFGAFALLSRRNVRGAGQLRIQRGEAPLPFKAIGQRGKGATPPTGGAS